MLDDLPKISLDELLNIRAAGTYLVKVDGDSMQGVGIFSGDLLITDRSIDARPGHVVIALLNQEPLVKCLASVCGVPVLRSANRKYPDRYVMEGDTLEIWGVVTASIRDHWRN